MRFTIVAVLMSVAWAIPAQAQQIDSRWTPWLGCWQLAGENVRVCVAPAADATGVTLSTHVGGAVAANAQKPAPVLEQTLIADGAQHPISEAECRGWQQTDWSRSGERLFARAELTCGDQSARKVSGLSMITAGNTWIDIQSIEIAGRENIRVRRYRRAADQTRGASVPPAAAIAPRLGATPFTLEEVKEASGRLSPAAVEAALVETNAGFNMSSRTLIDLDQAGVADRVIDAMVALSYPRHFVVDRPANQATASLGGFGGFDPNDTWFGSWPFPYYPSYWNNAYSSYYSPYYYAPFGYAYWAGYGGYYPYGFPGSGFVTIGPQGGADGGDGQSGGGRVINGVGYTRIRTRAEVEQAAASGRRTNGGTDSGDTSSVSSGSSGSSGSSSSGVSSGGFSSGASSTDTGRTAQPR